jgi:hypothetical protein
LTTVAFKAMEFEAIALAALETLPQAPRRRRGSPGRVVYAAAAQAVADVWSSATGRAIPRAGKVRDNHPLKALLHAVASDLFGVPGALSVSLLSVPKK